MRPKPLMALGVLLLVNFLAVWAQSVVKFWKWRHLGGLLMPESRYWLQSLVVLVPFVPLALMRIRHGRKILVLLLAALVVHAAGYLAKAHVPGSRRSRYLAACDWAVEEIRADYRGPTRDAEPSFSPEEYHPPERPVLVAHTDRVTYLLKGRTRSVSDIPDYIVAETNRIGLVRWPTAEFEKLAEHGFGGSVFAIYKRVDRGERRR